MHAISNYRGSRPTNRQDRLQYTAPQLARSVILKLYRTRCIKDLQNYAFWQTVIEVACLFSRHILLRVTLQSFRSTWYEEPPHRGHWFHRTQNPAVE